MPLSQRVLEWAEIPIPIIATKRSTVEARAVPVDRENPSYLEPLADLLTLGFSTESYYARSDGLNPPYYRKIRGSIPGVLVRTSLVPMLMLANMRLHSLELELHCLDGYRPVACQQGLWDFFMTEARRTLPNPTDDECYRYVIRYCSDPSRYKPEDPATCPTHLTGGSIDLTLRRRSGELLFMGGVFDDASEVSNTDHFEVLATRGELGMSQRDALRNRRILYHAMTSVGFTNYDYEWWHFDYGNAFWALRKGGGVPSRFGAAVYPGA